MADTYIHATIQANRQGDLLILEPYAQSEQPAQINYELTSRKEGPKGTLTSSQSGWVMLSNDEPHILSSLAFNLQPGDRYTISLVLYNGDRVIARQSMDYPKNQNAHH